MEIHLQSKSGKLESKFSDEMYLNGGQITRDTKKREFQVSRVYNPINREISDDGAYCVKSGVGGMEYCVIRMCHKVSYVVVTG